MEKKVITTEYLHKYTLGGGVFAIVFINLFIFAIACPIVISLWKWAKFIIPIFLLLMCVVTVLGIKKNNEFKNNPPTYVVMTDTPIEMWRVRSGTKKNRTYTNYYWFEALNKYHQFGWTTLTSSSGDTDLGKTFYLIKAHNNNQILFTFDAEQYSLSPELQNRLIPVSDVTFIEGEMKGKMFTDSVRIVKRVEL